MTNIPDLAEVVLEALDLHAASRLPALDVGPAARRLVIASGNALPTGRILFADECAVFCDEGEYEEIVEKCTGFDSVVLISASGTKHAPILLEQLMRDGHQPYLLTCNRESPAASLLPENRVIETPSRAEPITYNTSTYLGMILSKTRESPSEIKRDLLEKVEPMIPGLDEYAAFYLMTESRLGPLLEMFRTKFDELFGGRITGRCYTVSQTLHAKTVVPWEKELFIGLGVNNTQFGSSRINFEPPSSGGYAAMMALGYFVIGHLQRQRPPWFKEHASSYEVAQAAMFHTLSE